MSATCELIENPITTDHEDVIERLHRDAKRAATTLSTKEARYLVDTYYQMQDDRKRADNQFRALGESGEPNGAIAWLSNQSDRLETRVKQLLDAYSASSRLGRWARAQDGIGPVICAGLLAHIDVTKTATAGGVWRYAGLDPSSEWLGAEKAKALVNDLWPKDEDYTYEMLAKVALKINRRPDLLLGMAKHEETKVVTRASLSAAVAKRPRNAALKVLCWKIGESFVKVCNKDTAVYGKLYVDKKVKETALNDEGAFAEQARQKLEQFKIGKDTDAYAAYSQGKLPPAHIHSRAKRFAVKIFLSHFHHNAYLLHYGKAPPAPFAIAQLGHAHMIQVPELVD